MSVALTSKQMPLSRCPPTSSSSVSAPRFGSRPSCWRGVSSCTSLPTPSSNDQTSDLIFKFGILGDSRCSRDHADARSGWSRDSPRTSRRWPRTGELTFHFGSKSRTDLRVGSFSVSQRQDCSRGSRSICPAGISVRASSPFVAGAPLTVNPANLDFAPPSSSLRRRFRAPSVD